MELQHTKVSSDDSGSESMDSDVNLKQYVKNRKVKSKVTKQLDCHVKRVSSPQAVTTGNQARADVTGGEKQASDDLQVLKLKELQQINSRLDEVEDKVDRMWQYGTSSKDLQKLSKSVRGCSSKNSTKYQKSSCKRFMSDSDEDEIPFWSVLRTSRDVQRKVDKIAEIESASKFEGNDSQKLKSKRGGAVDVIVSKKVGWPHDTILGGPSSNGSLMTNYRSLSSF